MNSSKSRFSVAFREQARPIFAYWALLLFSFFIFGVAIFVTERGFKSEDIFILSGIYISSMMGCVLGQIAALFRFREIIGVMHGAIAFFCGAIVLAIGLPDFLQVFIGMYMLLGSIMFFAGLWSLQAGRAMFACWPPLLFAIGSVLVVVNNDSAKLNTWKSGVKWMIWDLSSLIGFVVAMVLLIAYLVIRENLRVFRWRNGPRTTIASEDILAVEDKARISAKGWTSLIFMSVLLSLGVAFLSPYLWQTAPPERYSSSDKQEERVEEGYSKKPQKTDCNNYSGCAPPPECREENPRQKKPPPEAGSEEQAQQVIEQVGNFLWILLWMLVLMLLAYLVFGAPMRRLFYVRHYRDPLWPVSPTKKIENQWDLIRIALADIGVQGSRGESAMNLVEQAIPRVKEVTGNSRRIPGLIAAAQIRDRVVFGLGVGVEDTQRMNENANWVYDSLWNRLGNWRQIQSLYRWKLW